MRLPSLTAACLALLTLTTVCVAAQPAPDAARAIDPTQRSAVVDDLADKLAATYVVPEVGRKLSAALRDKAAAGGYDRATTTEALAQALTLDLRDIGQDAHLRVGFDSDFQAPPPDAHHVPSADEVAAQRRDFARRGFGIYRVQRLPGNVGYLDIRGFGPVTYVGAAYSAAISLLTGTDALVLDLRRNGGGEPEAVAYLLSHFFPEGDERHLNSMESRTEGRTRESWTSGSAAPRYTRPIYVLTSSQTFSGGEECAYDLQTQKRATLVGETTGGGAHSGDDVALRAGFVAFIPTGRAINPITKTNWERVGVHPDVAVPASAAMKTAYTAILQGLLAKTTDPEERAGLAQTVANVESGAIELPAFVPMRR